MNRRSRIASVGVASAVTLVAFLAVPQSSSSKQQAAQGGQQMQLPPGMTEADMQACMEAGKPGAMHDHLARSIGVWQGKSTMWMTPDAEPAKSECACTITAMMDGRFTKCEMTSEMPGMGPFTGLGINGFDNVSQAFQSTWIDNQSTGIMTGTGDLSSDGETMTWNYTFNCPITKKPTVMREVEHFTGKDTMNIEMFTTDPKSGKEFKMMVIDYTRKGGTAQGNAR